MDFRQSSGKNSANRRKNFPPIIGKIFRQSSESDVKSLQLSKNRTFRLKFRKIFGGIENGFFSNFCTLYFEKNLNRY